MEGLKVLGHGVFTVGKSFWNTGSRDFKEYSKKIAISIISSKCTLSVPEGCNGQAMMIYNWFTKVRRLLRERGVGIALVKDVTSLRSRHKTMVV